MMCSGSGIRPAAVGVVLVVVAMLAALPSVLSIRCFVCNSIQNETCSDLKANDTAPSPFLHDCGETEMDIPPNMTPFCRKTILTTHIDGKQRVIRRCGYHKSTKECYHYDDEDHAEVVCQCFEDACNSARGLEGSATVRAFVASAAAAALCLLAR